MTILRSTSHTLPMPHLQLELSANLLEFPQLDQTLHHLVETFSACPTVDPAAIKAYARIHEHFKTGPGARPGFAHLTICLLTGRDQSTKIEISETMKNEMIRQFTLSHEQELAGITVEIRDMDRESYRKL